MNITRQYLNALTPTLSERDYAILETVGRFKLATGSQIEQLHFYGLSPVSTARNRQAVLKRLVDARLLAPVGQRPRGGADGGSHGLVYCLDVAGQHIAGLASKYPRRPYIAYKPNMAHYLAVAELQVQLVQAQRAGLLTLLTFDAEPYCWRDFGGTTLKPDAFVQVGLERPTGKVKLSAFLEVDRGDQWGTKIASKVPSYLAYKAAAESGRVMPRVMFLAPDERRVSYLRRLMAKQAPGMDGVFRADVIERFIEALTA